MIPVKKQVFSNHNISARCRALSTIGFNLSEHIMFPKLWQKVYNECGFWNNIQQFARELEQDI